MDSMEWHMDSIKWLMDSMEWYMDSTLIPYNFQMDSIPFSGWSPYGMSSWNYNSTLVSYHFQGGFHME